MSLARLVYFGVLLAIIAYLLMYFWERWLYVEGRGYVAMERHLLQTDVEGSVRGLDLRVGEAIKTGQPLFRIERTLMADVRDQVAWEDLKGMREIGLKRAMLEALRQEVADKEVRLNEMSQLKLLEFDRQRQRENILLAQDLANDRHKMAGLSAELAALRGYLAGARSQAGVRSEVVAANFLSPFEGFVYRLDKGEHEYAHRGDTVLILENAKKVHVIAYFSLDDLPRLHVGKALEILLPDGGMHRGIIERIDSASVDHQEKLARGYEVLEALVRVQIRPAAQPQDVDWRRYNQLDVKVRFQNWGATSREGQY
jgi:multidrug resistance efflux pump